MSWYIEVEEIPPVAQFVFTGVYINGEWCDTGRYKVKKGTKIKVKATIQNMGGTGWCRIKITDVKNDIVLGDEKDILKPLKSMSLEKDVTVNNDMEIVMEAYVSKDGKTWTRTARKGCGIETPLKMLGLAGFVGSLGLLFLRR